MQLFQSSLGYQSCLSSECNPGKSRSLSRRSAISLRAAPMRPVIFAFSNSRKAARYKPTPFSLSYSTIECFT